jgi:hypothetical protein
MLVLMLPLILYAWLCFQRPAPTPAQQTLFPGIRYQREVYSSPRPYLLHLVTVDLTTAGIRAFVTPKAIPGSGNETTARTTSQFLREFDLQLALNASYFYPFREKAPWDFYPHTGDRVKVLGQVISNGDPYSPALAEWGVLCISPNNRAQILESQCPAGTAQAVAGRDRLIAHGKPIPVESDSEPEQPYSRTAVGIDKAGKTLWFAIIDGKQPLYSEGVTLPELTSIFQRLGVDTALNLDGGGSVTLVANIGTKPTILNAPIHTKILMRERPLANHLGFYAQHDSTRAGK